MTPAIAWDVTVIEVSSPKVCDNMRLAAALTQECADGYSANGGVVISGVQVESEVVASLPSVSPSWIAVIRRQKL